MKKMRKKVIAAVLGVAFLGAVGVVGTMGRKGDISNPPPQFTVGLHLMK